MLRERHEDSNNEASAMGSSRSRSRCRRHRPMHKRRDRRRRSEDLNDSPCSVGRPRGRSCSLDPPAKRRSEPRNSDAMLEPYVIQNSKRGRCRTSMRDGLQDKFSGVIPSEASPTSFVHGRKPSSSKVRVAPRADLSDLRGISSDQRPEGYFLTPDSRSCPLIKLPIISTIKNTNLVLDSNQCVQIEPLAHLTAGNINAVHTNTSLGTLSTFENLAFLALPVKCAFRGKEVPDVFGREVTEPSTKQAVGSPRSMRKFSSVTAQPLVQSPVTPKKQNPSPLRVRRDKCAKSDRISAPLVGAQRCSANNKARYPTGCKRNRKSLNVSYKSSGNDLKCVWQKIPPEIRLPKQGCLLPSVHAKSVGRKSPVKEKTREANRATRVNERHTECSGETPLRVHSPPNVRECAKGSTKCPELPPLMIDQSQIIFEKYPKNFKRGAPIITEPESSSDSEATERDTIDNRSQVFNSVSNEGSTCPDVNTSHSQLYGQLVQPAPYLLLDHSQETPAKLSVVFENTSNLYNNNSGVDPQEKYFEKSFSSIPSIFTNMMSLLSHENISEKVTPESARKLRERKCSIVPEKNKSSSMLESLHSKCSLIPKETRYTSLSETAHSVKINSMESVTQRLKTLFEKMRERHPQTKETFTQSEYTDFQTSNSSEITTTPREEPHTENRKNISCPRFPKRKFQEDKGHVVARTSERVDVWRGRGKPNALCYSRGGLMCRPARTTAIPANSSSRDLAIRPYRPRFLSRLRPTPSIVPRSSSRMKNTYGVVF